MTSEYETHTVDVGQDGAGDALSDLARRHLWMHFTRMSTYDADHEVPVMVRGEGAYVYDQHGKRYLDGLAGLFTSQLGHGRTELAEASSKQAGELAYFPLWTYAHPRAIELADRLAELAPGNLNRVFFTSGGSEAVESAWKLARQYFRILGQPWRYKVISRDIAYHGTSMGALSITGIPSLKTPSSPWCPGPSRCPTRTSTGPLSMPTTTRPSAAGRPTRSTGPSSGRGQRRWPPSTSSPCRTPAGASRRPRATSHRVREICDRHGVLLVSDEVICAFGRLGEYFGSIRYDYQPDIITCAKGLTSGYAPLGAMIASDALIEPFLHGDRSFAHGFTFAGHPVSCAVALANLEVFERDDILGHVRRTRDYFRSSLESLYELPIVGEVRGEGFFYGIELVRDKGTKETFSDEEAESPAPGLPVGRPVRGGPHLPGRRPGRPGDPAVPAAHLRAGRDRPHDVDPPRRAVRGLAEDLSRSAVGVDDAPGYRRLSLWWDALSGDLRARPPLDRNVDVDVVVIGAGFTGLWTAHSLAVADPRLRVAVLEAEVAGFGASGRNGGWCSALFCASDAKIARLSGPDGARRMRRAMQASVDEVGRAAAAEGIDCHFAKGGTVVAARTPVQLVRAQQELVEARRFGETEADLRWLDADEARSQLGADGRPRGHLHPALRRPPARPAGPGSGRGGRATGGRLFEHSPVIAVEPGRPGRRPTVRTARARCGPTSSSGPSKGGRPRCLTSAGPSCPCTR